MSALPSPQINQSAPRASILIVDDESSIRRTLEGILHDEGFAALCAESGEDALRILREVRPSLIILDIWMPGLDGIETLKRIKQIYADVPVIMMSGHATIATAISATKLGATDFIEKPLDLHALIGVVHQSIEASEDSVGESGSADAEHESGYLSIGESIEPSGINPIAFTHQHWRGARLSQKTIANSIILYGQGLHSGRKSGLIFEPLPAYSGIHFVGVSENTPVPAHVEFVESTGFATTVKLGTTQAGTIEHLMSALHAYGITNLLIKCNGEVPVMDGSAREFCALIDEVGLDDQGEEWYPIRVPEVIRVGNEREFIQIEPADSFVIDYTLDYPAPIGRQHFVFDLCDLDAYKSEIAPCRTFGFVKDVGALQKQGLALGGRFDNFVLIGAQGPVNDALRFPDEPVRHKILDAIGDLYLLGRPLQGKVTAQMTGHSDNILLLKTLWERLKKLSGI